MNIIKTKGIKRGKGDKDSEEEGGGEECKENIRERRTKEEDIEGWGRKGCETGRGAEAGMIMKK